MVKSSVSAISIYTEDTPNPATMKFVVNKLLYPGGSLNFSSNQNTEASPLATALFQLPFTESVFIASNFITLTKTADAEWSRIIPGMKDFLKVYLEDGYPVVDEKLLSTDEPEKIHTAADKDDREVVQRIKEVLETYIQPVVEMDGGAIHFKAFENGKLSLILQGACSGCPSAMVTLKKGVESMMKRKIPEVKVVEEALE